MSAPKWTPGPWTLQTVPTSNGSGSCHMIGPFPSLGVHDTTNACVYADSVRIGIDDRGGGCKVADELLANAHLIAAAPDLAEALERTLNWLASYPGEGTMGPGGPYEEARAALAKARGES